MNYEDNIIGLINSVMPKAPLRKSIAGEVDAEVILLGDKEYLFTIDDFSGEDLLQEGNPYILGWNIACGAISDIIATGGKPLVYSHSMVIPSSWDETYIREFSKGVSAVLQKYSVSFIGGDLGIADSWRYTASVIGVSVGKPVNRRGCEAGDLIFMTGKIGTGNLEAFMSLNKGDKQIEGLFKGVSNQFPTHEKLPGIITKYATGAIDTSDGVFAALQSISALNETGYRITNLPLVSNAKLAAEMMQIPELLFFLGECGEYEILFTVKKQDKESLLTDLSLQEITVYELGEITHNPTQKTLITGINHYDLAEYQIRARDFKDVLEYVMRMVEWALTKVNTR